MRGFEETVVDWTQPRWFETVFFIVYWVAKLNALTASPQTMVRISPPASTYLNKGWWKLWSLWLKMMSKRLRCPSREGLVNVIFTGAMGEAEDYSKVDWSLSRWEIVASLSAFYTELSTKIRSAREDCDFKTVHGPTNGGTDSFFRLLTTSCLA